MPDEIEFTDVREESERPIRMAVLEFRAKYPAEKWSIAVHGLPEAPNFKVRIVTPDEHKLGPFFIPNNPEAGRKILALLEDLREEWHLKTPVILPPA